MMENIGKCEKTDERRTETIIIRMMPYEKKLIEDAARHIAADTGEAVPVSAWVRSLALSQAMQYLAKRENQKNQSEIKEE